MVKIKVTGADIPGLLSRLTDNGFVMQDLRHINPLIVTFCLDDSQVKEFKHIIKNLNCSYSVLADRSMGNAFRSLKKRLVLLLPMILLIFMSCWLPSRIFFIQVDGNNLVSATKILQQAENCGICFGAKRSDVRSEIVKNNLLESMPELRWAGINTRGCTAVIIVQENTETQEQDDSAQPSSVVASRDGIILSITSTSGFPACTVGQAVVKDQVLVSGRQTEGILLKTVRAKAEVFAKTSWNIRVVTPLEYYEKDKITASVTNYSIIIGKKRINLSKDSGISHAGCDKMYEEYFMTLPGGFVLPVSLVVETVVSHPLSQTELKMYRPEELLSDYAAQYLPTQMVSGIITGKRGFYQQDRHMASYEAEFICIEMIGRERSEELNFNYGKDH